MRTAAPGDGAPEGLVYLESFISEDEERQLLSVLSSMAFGEVVMRGQAARRTVRHFGLDDNYERGDLAAAEPLPDSMGWLRDRCAALMERDPADLAQILVSRYPAGAGIGWHRDAPMFGSRIAGVSLLAPCPGRAQRRRDRAGAALGVPVDGQGAVVVAALDPRDEGPALLGHVPHASPDLVTPRNKTRGGADTRPGPRPASGTLARPASQPPYPRFEGDARS